MSIEKVLQQHCEEKEENKIEALDLIMKFRVEANERLAEILARRPQGNSESVKIENVLKSVPYYEKLAGKGLELETIENLIAYFRIQLNL